MTRDDRNPGASPARSGNEPGARPSWFAASLAASMTLAMIAHAAPAMAAKPQPFKTTNIHFETNSSACDMGIQIAFDTEGIARGSVEDPHGQLVYSFRSAGGMAQIGGQTEGFLEGVEPQISELLSALGCEPSNEEPVMPLQQLFNAFPAGKYSFDGQGGGVTSERSAILSHRIPAGPIITAPGAGAVASPDASVLIEWEEVTSPILSDLGPVQIVGYHIVVEQAGNEPPPTLDIDVAEDVFSVSVPEQFLKPGMVYQFEVLATEKSGNQTITEGFFCTDGVAVCEVP